MSITEHTDVHSRRATRPDHGDVARVLTSAFLDDRVFTWLVPDRIEREALLVLGFRAYADAFAAHDETHLVTVDGTTAGVALWAPPGSPAILPADEEAFMERAGAIFGEHAERLAIYVELSEAVHPTDPVWYLQFVGVERDHQGHGLGSRLLRSVLARADQAGQPAHLEATSEQNRALYERHGFTTVAEIRLPDGPTVYPMRREPVRQVKRRWISSK